MDEETYAALEQHRDDTQEWTAEIVALTEQSIGFDSVDASGGYRGVDTPGVSSHYASYRYEVLGNFVTAAPDPKSSLAVALKEFDPVIDGSTLRIRYRNMIAEITTYDVNAETVRFTVFSPDVDIDQKDIHNWDGYTNDEPVDLE
ncbi:hypothetical protein ACFV9G_13535 [Nocardioides sp. NPDC059952]|uniref:hypothetical protein n=1 Tax=Nocardioides sp. NPDC059952 TaxID=3347014 RepID=UPI00366A1540